MRLPCVVRVGTELIKVSRAEYLLALIPKGTFVVFDRCIDTFLTKTGRRERGIGTLVGSIFYDGISGRIKLCDGSSVDVFPAFGDKVRRFKHSRDAAPWLGAGI